MKLLIFLIVFSFSPAFGLYAADTSDCIDINTAPKEELVKIKQIGESRAAQILRLREEKLFSSVDDMDRIAGIGPARITDIKEQGLACISKTETANSQEVAENGSLPKPAEDDGPPPVPLQAELTNIGGEPPNNSDNSLSLPIAIFTSFSGGVMILLIKRYVGT